MYTRVCITLRVRVEIVVVVVGARENALNTTYVVFLVENGCLTYYPVVNSISVFTTVLGTDGCIATTDHLTEQVRNLSVIHTIISYKSDKKFYCFYTIIIIIIQRLDEKRK